ncbi:helix-turn-helix domain-containing protein [Streptomyces sp. A5-4]|uniref:helix-turn-helix transcriptional regulator n=1 Tax=Streptomyces sp. A5-4 TaxID=3384771 RepID=UPI003DA7E2C6
MAEELGAILRDLRRQARLTQEQVAAKSGVSVSTIRRLENNRSTDHRMGTVNLLADALGAGPEDRLRLAATLAKASPESIPASAGAFTAPVPEPGLPDPALPGPTSEPMDGAARFPLPSARGSAARMSGVLTDAAEELAREVRRRWKIEEGQRRVHDPFPLPVSWHRAPAGLTDHPENIQRLQPGAEAGSRADLSGDLRDIARTYLGIESRRLVVLGRAGSGKSILAIRLVLDLLEAPAAGSPTVSGRVPVIFSLGSWDPTATALRDWLTDLLLRDHAHLIRRVPGGATLADALVDADLVLPVLDGFDEIAEGLRPAALEALNATSLPLVLTSRRAEFAEAVHTGGTPLVWAEAVELVDLTPREVGDYLPRTSRPVTVQERDGRVWDLVMAELHRQDTRASGNLSRVLSTPLMVVLARTMYSETAGTDPAELLDTTRFPTEHALEEHLLAGFVPTVYRRRAAARASGGSPGRGRTHDPEDVLRWLGHLAHHMGRLEDRDQQDLAWWRLGESLPRSRRTLTVMLACALALTGSAWFVGLLALPFGSSTVAVGLGAILLDGVLFGPVMGITFGSVYWIMARPGGTAFEPSHVRLRLPGIRNPGSPRIGRSPLRTFASRSWTGLLGGFVTGVGYACTLALERALYHGAPLVDAAVIEGAFVNMLGFGLIFGSVIGLLFGLVAALEAPLDIATAATPAGLLSANRQAVIRQLLVLVPAITVAIALGGRLIVDLLENFLGPLNWDLSDGFFIGAVGGLGGALSYALGFTAWGQWVIFTRVWLPLTGRLPWNTAVFLDDAYRRGVLRQAGAVYQFRHSRLQHHLADLFRRRHTDYAQATFTAHSPAPGSGDAAPADAAHKPEGEATGRTGAGPRGPRSED